MNVLCINKALATKLTILYDKEILKKFTLSKLHSVPYHLQNTAPYSFKWSLPFTLTEMYSYHGTYSFGHKKTDKVNFSLCFID